MSRSCLSSFIRTCPVGSKFFEDAVKRAMKTLLKPVA